MLSTPVSSSQEPHPPASSTSLPQTKVMPSCPQGSLPEALAQARWPSALGPRQESRQPGSKARHEGLEPQWSITPELQGRPSVGGEATVGWPAAACQAVEADLVGTSRRVLGHISAQRRSRPARLPAWCCPPVPRDSVHGLVSAQADNTQAYTSSQPIFKYANINITLHT